MYHLRRWNAMLPPPVISSVLLFSFWISSVWDDLLPKFRISRSAVVVLPSSPPLTVRS